MSLCQITPVNQTLETSPIFFTFAFFPAEEPIRFFLFWGEGRVPYNAGNTARFANVAHEHFDFKVGCPS